MANSLSFKTPRKHRYAIFNHCAPSSQQLLPVFPIFIRHNLYVNVSQSCAPLCHIRKKKRTSHNAVHIEYSSTSIIIKCKNYDYRYQRRCKTHNNQRGWARTNTHNTIFYPQHPIFYLRTRRAISRSAHIEFNLNKITLEFAFFFSLKHIPHLGKIKLLSSLRQVFGHARMQISNGLGVASDKIEIKWVKITHFN